MGMGYYICIGCIGAIGGYICCCMGMGCPGWPCGIIIAGCCIGTGCCIIMGCPAYPGCYHAPCGTICIWPPWG